MTGDPPEGGPQAGDTAAGGGTQNRAAGLRANAERDQAGRGGARRSGGRSTGPLLGVPRILSLAAKPAVALSQLARSELGQQHCAGIAQHPDDAGFLLEHLVLVSIRAPGGLVPREREDVLGAP